MGKLDTDTEAAARSFLERISGQYPVAGAIVYGSRARGTHQPESDADLAVLLDGPHLPLMRTALAMGDIAYDVLLDTGINISPLPIWLNEWQSPERHSNPALLRNIVSEGVWL